MPPIKTFLFSNSNFNTTKYLNILKYVIVRGMINNSSYLLNYMLLHFERNLFSTSIKTNFYMGVGQFVDSHFIDAAVLSTSPLYRHVQLLSIRVT